MNVYELNMDGLVGPTHHYAGLSLGNLASTTNALTLANPMAAALQGLQKMRLMHQLGLKQAIMPPHPRPNLTLLRQLGFSGSAMQMIQKAKRVSPEILSACYSASSMWTANAATVSPSTDTATQKVHFTAANLMSHLHRHQESHFSRYLLQQFFADGKYFEHHPPLPATRTTRDEGAANHSRLCQTYGGSGVHLFVYNEHITTEEHCITHPTQYPLRQTREASLAIARGHTLDPSQVIFAQQNPAVVAQGIFHNDVIAVANGSVLLIHEDAFVHQHDVLKKLRAAGETPFNIIEIKREKMSVIEAVKSYFFNSQLVTLPNQSMALIAPIECEESPRIKMIIEELLAANDNPISAVHYFNLKQSMRNGGGPACLRLRIVLNDNELQAMHQGILVDNNLLDTLESWVKRHYRTELRADSLDDPSLLTESYTAIDDLTALLKLGSIYPFQRA